ncbi:MULTISPECIES: tape measure protein [unclassified Acidovorax]|uniref:tape measure protein n=1 Tax=unclassified Acidovorax TaxID=2684926 RepID=UPI001C471AB6|nr:MULTISPECIES: tape measure protein [unclassified Acidovorax]MBV7458782.1 tape measure protein [Acidovorax sp. sif0632]MBV7463396.1 tape measure protein [Acidovorax sp. sif0613]
MSGRHEIGIVIKASTEGEKSITDLAQDLENLAKVAEGDLQQAARAAAAQLRQLGEQDAAISTFLRLQQGVAASTKAMNSAASEAANYARQIAQAGPATAQEAAALQRLETAAEGARVELSRQTDELAAAQAALQRFGIAGKNAEAAQQRIREEVALVRTAVDGIAPAYQRAATGAEAAGASMVRTHRQIGDGVESISQQIGRLQGFVAGLAGLQGLKSMATDLAQTADQVNNLQARLKIATGEGEAFGVAWAGVQDVALRTNSALDDTGTLFTRLAQTAKDAGASTADASAGALGLTETINQAIQLSGASAQASSAAITQLVQGLQGGVLRGDEFNSIMEQSPRLARALADGLSVTTGELRKMAEAGLLTSETVIGALKGQSDAVAAEFSKLPPTVGRALQNLSTQWQLYVADTDKATGASTAAAGAINALAGNLKTIADLLIDAGQAAAAFAALRLAQHFLGIGAAAQQAAVAMAAHNAQMAATGAAANVAAAGVGRMATIFASLRTFTLIGLLVNIKDIGTWLGEAAAKLAGYKDRTEELARAEKLASDIAKEAAADRARLAAATQAAIDKQFELSKASRSAVAEFDQLTKNGTAAAEAIKKITEGFDLSKLQGVKDFAATLDKLVADGKVSASEFQAAWAQALSGKDLAQFEVMARAAFSGAAREGERVAQVMDAILHEAVKRTGLDFEELQGKIGAASRSAINDLDALIVGVERLKAQGLDAGRVLTASFVNAINTADSEKALEAIRAKVEEVRSVLGDKIADGLLDQAKEKAEALADALDKATPGINSVREAIAQLGITSDESLRKTAATAKEAYDTLTSSGLASARELSEGFRKAAEAAIAANNGVAPSWVAAAAAMRGFEIEVDRAGKSTLRLRDATNSAADAHGRAARATRDQATELERLNAQKEREIAAQEKANQLKEREIELYLKKWNMDNQHRSLDADGKVREEDGMPTKKGIFDRAKKGGMTDEEALAFADAFDTNSLRDRGSRGTPFINLQKLDEAINEAVMEAIRRRINGTSTDADKGGTSSGQGGGATPGRASGSSAGVGSSGYSSSGVGALGQSSSGVQITMNVHGIQDPVKLARLMEPELKRLARLAR